MKRWKISARMPSRAASRDVPRPPGSETPSSPVATVLIAVGLSALAFGYGVQSVIHDLGALHVQHPDWPGHARMHVVWMLVLSFMLGVGVVGLAWWPSPRRGQNLVIAAALNVLPFASFVVSWMSSSAFGGRISDGTAADAVQAQSNAMEFAMGLPLSIALLAWAAHQLRRENAGAFGLGLRVSREDLEGDRRGLRTVSLPPSALGKVMEGRQPIRVPGRM